MVVFRPSTYVLSQASKVALKNAPKECVHEGIYVLTKKDRIISKQSDQQTFKGMAIHVDHK